MTAIAISLPSRRVTRRQATILVMVVACIAALLYFEYQTYSQVAPSTDTQADTMCMASRIGLEGLCR